MISLSLPPKVRVSDPGSVILVNPDPLFEITFGLNPVFPMYRIFSAGPDKKLPLRSAVNENLIYLALIVREGGGRSHHAKQI